MEQRAKIVVNEKFTKFCEDIRAGLEVALNFMLGTGSSKVNISKFDAYMMPMETFLAEYQKKAVIVRLYVANDYVGEIYWFFEMKSAIIFGSLMRMIPLGAVNDKIRRDVFDTTDHDAFGEVGNQLCGILDRAFRQMTGKNVHLRMDFKKSIYPSESVTLDHFIHKEEYVTLIANMNMPQEYGMQEMTLLLPRSLVQVMLNIEVELESFKAKKVLLYHWNPNLREKIQTEMNSRYTKVVPVEAPEEIFAKLDLENIFGIGIGLRKLRFPLPHDDTIFLRRLAGKLQLSHTPYFLGWENPSDEGLRELAKVGLTQATKANLAVDFIRWADAITMDPSRPRKS